MALPPQLKDALIAIDGLIAPLTLNRDDVLKEPTFRTAEWYWTDNLTGRKRDIAAPVAV